MPIVDSVAPPGTQLLSFHWVLYLAVDAASPPGTRLMSFTVARELLSAAHLGVLRLIRTPWITQRCKEFLHVDFTGGLLYYRRRDHPRTTARGPREHDHITSALLQLGACLPLRPRVARKLLHTAPLKVAIHSPTTVQRNRPHRAIRKRGSEEERESKSPLVRTPRCDWRRADLPATSQHRHP